MQVSRLVVGLALTAWVAALPSDFLSTPFGMALRPSIDAMFTDRPVNGVPARPAASGSPDPALAASLFQSVAAQAQATTGNPPPAPVPTPLSRTTPAPDAPLTAPMHITTNPASFQSLLRSHRAVVAFFTSATCGPCRMIEPVFEDLAKSKSRPDGGVGFAKIDLSVGLGGAVASAYQVRATPTFIFFLDGRKVRVVIPPARGFADRGGMGRRMSSRGSMRRS